jgi:hypothetical protein
MVKLWRVAREHDGNVPTPAETSEFFDALLHTVL